MTKEILIQEKFGEYQIALIEDGKLSEFYIDSLIEKNIIGNIYKCKINKVLENVSACFVELDNQQNAYLYSKDISYKAMLASNIINENIYNQLLSMNKNDRFPLLNYLKPGQCLIVQGKRNSLNKKHPKVTCKIAIPGKYIVYLPFHSTIAVSKKIKDNEIRKTLRKSGKSICKNSGVIFRTSSANTDINIILDELNNMKKKWENILDNFAIASPKSLIFKALPLIYELLMDFHYEEELKHIKVSCLNLYNDILNFCSIHLPNLKNKISLCDKQLFEIYKINSELEKAMQSHIWLKSGAYLVFNYTEALTSIDVNTGKINNNKKAELNMLSINLEAIQEICRQIRIRNIGGIIIIDFLPVSSPQFNELFEQLRIELNKDKAKIKLSKDENASLAIIIRKKTRDSLLNILSAKCPYCKGSGIIKSIKLICREIIDQITSKKLYNSSIKIIAHPSVISCLSNLYIDIINKIKETNLLSIEFIPNSKYHLNKFELEY